MDKRWELWYARIFPVYKILREKQIFETYSLSSRSVQIVNEMYECTYVSKLTE